MRIACESACIEPQPIELTRFWGRCEGLMGVCFIRDKSNRGCYRTK